MQQLTTAEVQVLLAARQGAADALARVMEALAAIRVRTTSE